VTYSLYEGRKESGDWNFSDSADEGDGRLCPAGPGEKGRKSAPRRGATVKERKEEMLNQRGSSSSKGLRKGGSLVERRFSKY